MAHHGTLFLDEIGEMPLDLQSKLLRVLQDRRVSKLGQDSQGIEINFRLICATNKDLKELIAKGQFREDLYYRINVVEIQLPPLRDRQEDLPDLAKSILETLSFKRGWRKKTLSEEALDKLKKYSWPGNIRELQNRLENAHLVSQSSAVIEAHHIQIDSFALIVQNKNEKNENIIENKNNLNPAIFLPKFNSNKIDFSKNFSLKDAKAQFEIELINQCIEYCDGNKSEAARILGMSREGLRKAFNKHKVA